MKPASARKVLFVCAQNKIRSFTAEKLFTGAQEYQVRSRGVAKSARIKLTAGDIGWADIVFVMEKNHQDRITKDFRDQLKGKTLVCLFIKDIYQPMETALIEELQRKTAPHLPLPKMKEPRRD